MSQETLDTARAEAPSLASAATPGSTLDEGAAPRPTNLVEVLRRHVDRRPGEIALTFLPAGDPDEEESLTYSELDREARRIAAYLSTVARPGERALILMPQGLDYVTAFFGCLYARVTAVTAHPPANRRQVPRIRSMLRDAGASWALADDSTRERCLELFGDDAELGGLRWLVPARLEDPPLEGWERPEGLDAESLAFLQYTSGSTSEPKGVMVSHGNLLHNTGAIVRAMGIRPGSTSVFWLPLFHDMGLIGGPITALRGGYRCVLMAPEAFLRRPSRWLRALSKYRAQLAGGPNFAYDLCAEKIRPAELEGLDLSHWEVAFNGAEPIRAQTLRRFAARFEPCGFDPNRFFPCYGLAEGTLMVAGGPAERPPTIRAVDSRSLEAGRVGEPMHDGAGQSLVGSAQPIPGGEVLIVDPEAREPVGPARVGEIWVAGPSVAKGYWNRPEQTAETFEARLRGEEGRFLRTGDLGFMADGELFVTGRLKDLIIVRGRNLYPQDLERTSESAHPATRSGGAAVFALDGEDGERVVVVQEVDDKSERGGGQPEEIASAIRRDMAEEHELPIHSVVLIRPRSLLKTTSGKVRRRAVRAAYLAGELAVVEEVRERGTDGTLEWQDALSVGPPDPDLLLRADVDERRALVEDYLRTRLALVFRRGTDDVEPDEPLTDLGLDSLKVLDLVNRIELELGVSVEPGSLLESPTLGEISRDLAARIGETGIPEDSMETSVEREIAGLSEAEVDDRLRELLTEEKR